MRRTGAAILLCVWCASMSLGACGSTVEQPCAASCDDENARGRELFDVVSSECACEGCSDACKDSVCIRKQTPSDACLPCVQEALRGDGCKVGLFNAGCFGHEECVAFVDCLEACPAR